MNEIENYPVANLDKSADSPVEVGSAESVKLPARLGRLATLPDSSSERGEDLSSAEVESPVEKPKITRLRPAEGLPQLLQNLTARELDVLGLVTMGLQNKEIAHRLCVGEETIKFHLGNTYRKLVVSNRVEASIVAYESGLLEWAPKSNGTSGFTGEIMIGTKTEQAKRRSKKKTSR